MESVGIYCPGNLQVSGLLVTVNFTKLNVPLTDLSLSSVYVYIGLTNATFDSPIGKAEPIPLSPGLNLLGHLTYYFHQGPVKRDLTTFGFQSVRMIKHRDYTYHLHLNDLQSNLILLCRQRRHRLSQALTSCSQIPPQRFQGRRISQRYASSY